MVYQYTKSGWDDEYAEMIISDCELHAQLAKYQITYPSDKQSPLHAESRPVSPRTVSESSANWVDICPIFEQPEVPAEAQVEGKAAARVGLKVEEGAHSWTVVKKRGRKPRNAKTGMVR